MRDLVVVANRLPVDLTIEDDGSLTWHRAPGGLVTALEPVMQDADGAWVGWSGKTDFETEPFENNNMQLVPVPLAAAEQEDYYEGFSNGTLWPLYHDVIAPPVFHRHWWDSYRRVNERFAHAAAAQVAEGGTVWVHDYQLQLVPQILRELRPDVKIGFFLHIPFPPLEIFAQMPWRTQILRGLLGADLLGFQRTGDAQNFVRAARQLLGHSTRGLTVSVNAPTQRTVHAGSFPISIASAKLNEMAQSPQIRARAAQIREELGNPDKILLGVDRLDYTKGILHRLKAYGELVEEGRVDIAKTTLVQVASPSRQNVDSYQQLREEVELTVGRINGTQSSLGHTAIHYLYHSYPYEEMAALYLAADVLLVTSLRDGMNLVAKEYIACRSDLTGTLVLSEFTGAAEELGRMALLVNPHDIDGMKDTISYALEMPPALQRRRMRQLRRRVLNDDVAKWADRFLARLSEITNE